VFGEHAEMFCITHPKQAIGELASYCFAFGRFFPFYLPNSENKKEA